MKKELTPERPSGLASRRLRCTALLAAIIPLGLVWRLAPLHLPPFAFKYGGSLLWAAAVYWLAAAVFLRLRPLQLAALAALIATAVELLKLVFWPPLDHFRETLAGKLLLGRYFSSGALLAYGLAILLTSAFDTHQQNRKRSTHQPKKDNHGPHRKGAVRFTAKPNAEG